MNCKPGDRAFIVAAVDKRNIGRVVRVQGAPAVGDLFPSIEGLVVRWDGADDGSFCWIVESEGDALWWVGDADGACRFPVRVFSDSRLRPIRGDVTEDEVTRLYSLPVAPGPAAERVLEGVPLQ